MTPLHSQPADGRHKATAPAVRATGNPPFPWWLNGARAVLLGMLFLGPAFAPAQLSPPRSKAATTAGDEQLTAYLRSRTHHLSDRLPAEVKEIQDWAVWRRDSRRQLQEMLGLWPLPERTDLQPVVTGTLDHDAFTVEKIHFQASPHLYCTANLYIPKGLTTPAPTVLYACGHWKLIRNGVSYGNKAMYQVDGAWFARNGYVCLVLDTLLAGEIQGIHTGTRDHGLWWWNSRGYTPAGVEAWFGIRALDYLSTRPEVDTNRFGITGHSGGGAYSWSVTALDDRIKAAAPLAGMTTVHHHVLDNLMDSHCDCNFPVNIHRWDFPRLAALAAPRPLLLGGTDNDGIFPLAGTLSIHQLLAEVYRRQEASPNLGLAIAPGGHDEVPELRLAVLRWFNRHLRGLDKTTEPPVVVDAERYFEPEELKVFTELPPDAINTNIAESFVAVAPPQTRSADALRPLLNTHVFAGWPDGAPAEPNLIPAFSVERDGLRFAAWDFFSEPDVQLRLYQLAPAGRPAESTELHVLDTENWADWVGTLRHGFEQPLRAETLITPRAEADTERFSSLRDQCFQGGAQLLFLAPRGVGLTAWSGDDKRMRRLRRRFMILGQTMDSMRVWDIRQATQAISRQQGLEQNPLTICARGFMGVNALYAALFEPNLYQLILDEMPATHIDGPDYLGILKITDIPEVLQAVSAQTPGGVHCPR